MPPSVEQLPITLVVITYNEVANIARCLDSVTFAAEKLVIDSGSEDDTVAIAQAHGARVVHQLWLGFGAQRNFAAAQASHNWLLCLDADEALTPELVNELQHGLPALMNSNMAAGVMIRSAEFMGKRMSWYRLMARERKARIYHRQRARWSDVRVHESLKYSGSDMIFKSSFIHYLNPTLVHHELKYLKYAELKARDWNERHRSVRPFEWPFVFLATFIKDYFFRLAILDGWRGFAAAWMAANYALYKRLRYFEMREYPESIEFAKQELRAKKLER